MFGVTLSRWSMTYFAAALCALMFGEALMVAGYGFPSNSVSDPQTLILVHVIVIGWLSLLLCGALFQFVPVLVARPLYSNMLPLPALIFLLAGLTALLLGFLQIAGTIDMRPPLLPFAALLLVAGFVIVLWNLACTLWPARPLPLPARFVAIALLSLAATVFFGFIFSFVLTLPIESEILLRITANGLPLHAVAGIGGWLTFAAMGVSYRLLAMFMLAPELDGTRPRAALWLGTAALGVVILGGLALLLYGQHILPALVFGGVLGLGALALYGADIAHLYRARKRRIIELNSQMAVAAFVMLGLSVLLGIVLIALGILSEHVGALVFLIVFGWLSGLGLAKLYKIVAFLTWLESYGPVLGKSATPRVQDLVIENHARKWFALFFVAVLAATIALLVSQPLAFRAAAGATLIATIAIVAQLVRARLLHDVPLQTRLPDIVRRPHLLFSVPAKR